MYVYIFSLIPNFSQIAKANVRSKRSCIVELTHTKGKPMTTQFNKGGSSVLCALYGPFHVVFRPLSAQT